MQIQFFHNSSMIPWMKKNYDDLGEKCWQSYDINNQAILRPFAKDVPCRLKIQSKQNQTRILTELGLIQKRDKTGHLSLLNNLPIKTKISKKQTNNLINRLNKGKK